MVKDIKYIIKKILIGVGIFLVMSFLRGNLFISAHALTVDSQSIGPQVWSVNNTIYWVNASANNLWYNWDPGYVEFSFSINKMNQDSVSPLVTPKNVVLSTSTKDFTCNIGSTSANNSTYVTQVYSVSCPVSLSNAGVTRVTINLMPLVNTPYETYEIYFNGLLSYVDTTSSFTSNVNVDNSGVINSQNQNSQSIINNQNQNTQSIINNQNQNTQAIVDSNNQLNNTLNDDTGGDVSSSWFDDFRSNSSTPVSDLLTMPITLMEAYLDGFSGNCQSMNLGKLYGTYIIIPCLNIADYLGDDLWNLIDVLFSMFMVYNIGMLCVSIYEGITGLQDDMQFLYSPRHAGAGDTRVERYGDDY